jgi:tRNA-Thr(GGU) m(6)t(6)A37 methyltransferase TsaA
LVTDAVLHPGIKEHELSPSTDNERPIALKAIASVRNDVKEPEMRDWRSVVSDIVCDPALSEALDGLEEFSHIMVVFWMHRAPSWDPGHLKTHPQRRQDLPLVGVLATRSPHRPNPLGVSVVKLLERRDNVLRVIGLDAIDGTPVVDIKSHIPDAETAEAGVPDWVYRLRRSAPGRAS